MQQSLLWSKNNRNAVWEENVLGFWYENYRDIGEYEKAFDAFQKIQNLRVELTGKADTFFQNYALAELHRRIGNYATALNYYHYVIQSMDLEKENIWYRVSYPELFALNNKFDSAQYYYNKIDTLRCSDHELRFFLISQGECYLLQKKYKEALWFLRKGLKYHRDASDLVQVKRALFDLGKTYQELNDETNAINYTNECLQLSLRSRSKQHIRDAYQVLYNIYEKKGITDSAFFYYRKYMEQNKLVENDNIKGKFAAYNYEQKINELGKEKIIQQAALDKTSTQKTILISGLVILFLVAVILFRNFSLKRKNEKSRREIAENELLVQKLENEKAKAALLQRAAELEMQALRSQMNPHFIFNSLNAINRFILQNNKTQASEYLTKFSKLVRMMLQNSQAPLITLESELDSLNLYLQLETLRFEQHFSYNISVPPSIETDILKVPPLIIQPYVENAIWHGLMHKEDHGHLEIEIGLDKSNLLFRIRDDGIGREKAEVLSSKSATRHKSMGLKITAERIAMMQSGDAKSPVVINDLVHSDGSAAGTEVIIKIPVEYG